MTRVLSVLLLLALAVTSVGGDTIIVRRAAPAGNHYAETCDSDPYPSRWTIGGWTDLTASAGTCTGDNAGSAIYTGSDVSSGYACVTIETGTLDYSGIRFRADQFTGPSLVVRHNEATYIRGRCCQGASSCNDITGADWTVPSGFGVGESLAIQWSQNAADDTLDIFVCVMGTGNTCTGCDGSSCDTSSWTYGDSCREVTTWTNLDVDTSASCTTGDESTIDGQSECGVYNGATGQIDFSEWYCGEE